MEGRGIRRRAERARGRPLLLLTAAALGALGAVGTSAAAAADRLPDLGMARVSDIRVSREGGQRLLRYTTTIVNVGGGVFEARGRRPDTGTAEMSVVQRIYNDAGGYRDVSVPTTMFFAGDGHTHWHLKGLEESKLLRADGSETGRSRKQGFCFFDNVAYRTSLAGSPQSPVYGGCGHASDLSVTMGLSIGWGDAYYWNLPDQYVNITHLSDGRYRLVTTADPSGWFAESSEQDNGTWVDLRLRKHRVTVLGYGPAA